MVSMTVLPLEGCNLVTEFTTALDLGQLGTGRGWRRPVRGAVRGPALGTNSTGCHKLLYILSKSQPQEAMGIR